MPGAEVVLASSGGRGIGGQGLTIAGLFGGALIVAVLVSGIAARSVLSTSLLFLGAGALAGPSVLGIVRLSPHSPSVTFLADLALFTVLFVDGQRAGLRDLREAWRLTGRALGFGMPLTMVGIALIAWGASGLDWTTAFLVGAILSPTDPVFAAAIVGREDVPYRLRRLLNIESGLNDGLALPFVVILLALARHGNPHVGTVIAELVGGVALGVAMPIVLVLLLRLPALGSTPQLQPLGPFALAVCLYATAHVSGANPYLAAFAAGSTVSTLAPEARHAFEQFGDLLAELTKFAALLVFGALLTGPLFSHVGAGGYVVAVVAIVLVRPASILISLLRTPMPRRERLAAAWFGPKGFASVVYGLLALESGIPGARTVFAVVAVTIALSIAAHSSSDVPIARLFHVEDVAGIPDEPG